MQMEVRQLSANCWVVLADGKHVSEFYGSKIVALKMMDLLFLATQTDADKRLEQGYIGRD